MYQDFTTYTKVDPDNKINVSTNEINWSNLYSRNYYVYKDFGVDFFGLDFEHKFQSKLKYAYGQWSTNNVWALSTSVGPETSFSNGDIHIQLRHYYDPRVMILEKNGEFKTINISDDVDYYLTIKRVDNEGTNGRLYVYVYSNPERTTLVGSDYINLNYRKKFRYHYALCSENAGGSYNTSGNIKNVDLGATPIKRGGFLPFFIK